MEEKGRVPGEYCVAGRDYVQKPITLGQGSFLQTVMKTIQLDTRTPTGVVEFLLEGDRLSLVAAGLLMRKGMDRVAHQKMLDAMSTDFEAERDHLRAHMSYEQAVEMVADFFDFNLTSSISNTIKGIVRSITERFKDPEAKQLLDKTNLNGSTPSSPEETPQKENPLDLLNIEKSDLTSTSENKN